MKTKTKKTKPTKTKPQPSQWPVRADSDAKVVSMLLDEAERLAHFGRIAVGNNDVAAESTLRASWAFSLAGAWLRCKLKLEVLPECDWTDEEKHVVRTKLQTVDGWVKELFTRDENQTKTKAKG